MNEFDTGVTQEDTQDYLDAMQATQEEEVEQFESELPPAVEGAAAPTEAPAPAVQEQPAQQEPQGDAQPEERAAGKDGSVRDVFGMVQDLPAGIVGRAIDMVDNVFQGDQRSYEDIRAQMKEGEEARKADRAANPVSFVLDETEGALKGMALDAVEDTLSAAEVLGDTAKVARAKVLPSLGNVEDSQNPFNTNYDWAQWKLGADEVGAKTPVGMLAQELGSYALIGSKLGAFKSFGGGFTATTKLGTAGQLMKAGAAEAGYGMITDALKGLAGEGNLANMLESVSPGLKDTWVTALSVDEDDGPWDAAWKSALDGAALGFPVGILGNIASAIRHVKNLPVAEQATKALEIFAEKTQQMELPINVKPAKKLEAYDVAREMQDGDFSRIDQVSDEGIKELVGDSYGINDYSEDPFAFSKALGFRRQMEIFGEGTIQTKLKNGSELTWAFNEVDKLDDGSPVVRLDWTIPQADADAAGLGQGGAGVEAITQLKGVLKEADMKPGTVIATEPAKDSYQAGARGASDAQNRAFKKGRDEWYKKNSETAAQLYDETYGEGAFKELEKEAQVIEMQNLGEAGKIDKLPKRDDFNQRARLYEKAGFSKPDEFGTIWGVVKQDPQGRKLFAPFDPNGDAAAQIAAAKEFADKQLKLPAMDVIAERQRTGVPVYWDDVAETMPEMFTPGARAVQPDFAPSVYEQLRNMDPEGGVSLDPFTGETPPTGTMVAIDGVSLESLEPNDVMDFIADNYDILTREDVFLGGWVSDITGKPVVELSRRVENFEEAKALAKAFDQEAVFRMDDFTQHNTGGIDKLKETKGFHQRSAYTQPNYVRTPTDAQSVARLQFHPQAQPGGQGRLYTDAQIAKVAEAEGDYVASSLDNLIENIEVRAEDMADMLPVDEVYKRVSYDLDDFIDDGGHVDVTKLTKGEDGLLDQVGSLQTRILISNISSTIFNEARNVQMKGAQNIDPESSLEIMSDNLKVLLRLHKKVANTRSRQLSQFAMPINKAEAKKYKADMKAYTAQDKGMDIAEKAIDEMVAGLRSGDAKRIRQAKRTAAFMEMSGGDPSKIAKVAKGIPGLVADVMLKHMYNSLLSSPATHIVNTFSNFTQTVARPLSAALGGQAGAAKASFYNFNEMLAESWDLAARTWDEGSTQGSKMVQTSETDIALQNLAAQASTPTEKRVSGILNVMNDFANYPAVNWPSKFLTTSDEFFKAFNARMEYRVQNFMEAQELAKVTPGKDADTIMREMMSDAGRKSRNFGAKDGQIMDEKLLDVAKELTFQTELEGPAGLMAKLVEDLPVLRPFFPFVKTGHNILVYTGTHTPVLNYALKESRKALRGDLGAYAQAVHRGRIAMGTMTMTAAGIAAYNGILTGSGPKDKNRRSEWLKTHQPRSIKVGDKWVSLERLEPFGQLLSAAADIVFAIQSKELETDKAAYLTQYLMYAISANLTDKTFFTGIKDLNHVLAPNGAGADTKALNSGLNLVNNFLPGAGIRRAATNAFNPYMQEYYKNYDRTLQQMGMQPFITEPWDKIDHLTGEKIDSPSAGLWNALMPVKVVERGSDVVKDALEDIYFETSEIRKEIGAIDLTPKQSSRLNELMAESGLHARIKKIVTNPLWRKSVDQYYEDMANGTTTIDRTDHRFYSDIVQLYRQHQTLALEQLKYEFPELGTAIDANQRLKKQAKYGYIQGLIQYGNN